jgi:hypothetical protein
MQQAMRAKRAVLSRVCANVALTLKKLPVLIDRSLDAVSTNRVFRTSLAPRDQMKEEP